MRVIHIEVDSWRPCCCQLCNWSYCSEPLLLMSAVGDIFLLEEKDIIRTNLSVREGLGK
jgi:hypothetical protein